MSTCNIEKKWTKLVKKKIEGDSKNQISDKQKKLGPTNDLEQNSITKKKQVKYVRYFFQKIKYAQINSQQQKNILQLNIEKKPAKFNKAKKKFSNKMKINIKSNQKKQMQYHDIIGNKLFTNKGFMKNQMSFCLRKMRINTLRVSELLDQSFIMKLENMILSTNTHDNIINDQEKPFSEDLSERKRLQPRKKRKNKNRKLIKILEKLTYLLSLAVVKNDQLFYYLAMQKLLNHIQLCLLRLLELIPSMQHNCYHAQLIIYLIKLMGCSIQKKQFAKQGQKTKSEVEIQNEEIQKQNTKSPKSVSIKASPSPQKKKLDRSKQIRIENLLFNKNRRFGQIQSKEQYQYEQTIIRLITN